MTETLASIGKTAGEMDLEETAGEVEAGMEKWEM